MKQISRREAHIYIKFFCWNDETYCTRTIFYHVEGAIDYGRCLVNASEKGYKAFQVYSIHKLAPLYIGVYKK